jgi:hypothetical protein
MELKESWEQKWSCKYKLPERRFKIGFSVEYVMGLNK